MQDTAYVRCNAVIVAKLGTNDHFEQGRHERFSSAGP